MDCIRQALRRWGEHTGQVKQEEKQGSAFIGKPHTPQIRQDLQIPDLAFTIDRFFNLKFMNLKTTGMWNYPLLGHLRQGVCVRGEGQRRWRERICHCGRSAESSLWQPFLLCSCLRITSWVAGPWTSSCLPVLGQSQQA